MNYYTFWVSNSLVKAHWIQLPPITRRQLTTARRVKQFFSGSLMKAVASHPPFEGQEAHYVPFQ